MESLYNEFKKFNTAELLKDFDTNRLFPTIDNRTFWENISSNLREDILNGAYEIRNFKYNMLSAGRIMEYSETGNRVGFEGLYFENRENLCRFIIAECLENKGTYMRQIIDGLWLICEESSWALPAHYFLSGSADVLPDIVSDDIIDLYACETAQLLSVAAAVLKPALDKVSCVLYKRLVYEVNTRVLRPFLSKNDVFWMGFTEQSAVNNWNPWCSCNCLAAALLAADSKKTMLDTVDKAVKCVDVFYKGYGDDGGCDEGPGYWDRAAASLFELLELLFLATDGKINFGGDKKLLKMGEYIKNAAASEDSFINFADARANTAARGDIIYRFGKYVGSRQLMSFGAAYERRSLRKKGFSKNTGMTLRREMMRLCFMKELCSFSEPCRPEPVVYMSDIEVMVARSGKTYNDGMMLAAKFGSNGEAHNHNDVGNFIIYKEGKPVCIDVGVGVYTDKTFSDERYDIWYFSSAYHNTPMIGSAVQKDGKEHCAHDCVFLYDEQTKTARFSADISRAYELPPECRLSRRFDFKDDKIMITDAFEHLSGVKKEIVFMLCKKPEVFDGTLTVSGAKIECDTEPVSVKIDEIGITDPLLKECWGEKIYRARFVFAGAKSTETIIFTVK